MRKIILPFFAVLAFTHTASAVIVDFDDIQAGTIVDNEYNSMGVSISAINFDNGLELAVAFDTGNPTGGDYDLGAPFFAAPGNPNGSIDPGNVLIIQENGNCDTETCTTPDDEGSRPGGQFTIEFDQAVYLESIDFFDIELPEAGPTVDNQIFLYNSLGELIPFTFFTPDTGGDNQWARLFFGDDGVDRVTRVVINMGGSGAIDNINFSQVPVPGALPLFLSGLVGMRWLRKS